MNQVDDRENIKGIVRLLENTIKENFDYIGNRKWGNPSGDQPELKVYEIEDGVNKIWLSTSEWCKASNSEVNRSGIITTMPDYNGRNTLGQIFEINMPYYYSKSFNTRVYEKVNEVEIRNYGKFTIGRRGLKRQYFFDYLRENGFEDEIILDEEDKEFISIIRIKDDSIDTKLLISRLIKWTVVVKEFKDYYRRLLL